MEVPGRIARATSEGAIVPLEPRVLIRFSGSDRVRYLNGQVTNDVRKIETGIAMLACVVSAKGKLDAVVQIWAEGDDLVVEAPLELQESLPARFERYIVADDVTLETVPARAGFHAIGPAADALRDSNDGGLTVNRFGIPGYDLVDPTFAGDEMPPFTVLAPEEAEVLRILIAHPKWGAELGADTLPAEAGLDKSAVDFHKGCYIGQEVISRIQSVGRTNRSLQQFEVVGDEPPSAGEEIFTPDSDRALGMITSIAVHFELPRPVGLCYIKRGLVQDQSLVTQSGAALKLLNTSCAS